MRISWLLHACVLVAGVACNPAPRLTDAEIRRMAVEALQQELGAASPILLHPLLIHTVEGEPLNLEHASFNAFDPNSVPEVIALGSSELALCETDRAGLCHVPRGSVAVVLSELQDLHQNGIGVGALVIDGREGRPRQRYFMVRVKAGSAAWRVVEVTAVQ